jgi:D-3-phosphoglycerate dehydrogenase
VGGSSRGRIAVTPRSLSKDGHPALDRITEAGYEVVFPSPGATPTFDEQLAVIPSCVGYLAGVEPVTAELLQACPDLRVISRNGVGIDSVDLATAERCGIAVVNAPSANSQGVAELTIALMLASVRAIAWSDAGLKAGEWRRRQGFEIAGRTLGLVGCGNIGRRVARMAIGLGMSVVGVDSYLHPELLDAAGFSFTDMDRLLFVADVVSLHCPPADRAVIGAPELAVMRPHAHLINTARAGLVDDSAVLAALDEGRLAGFATDVFGEEPPPRTPVIEHPRVTVTPHVGGYTLESVDRATTDAVVNLLGVLEGQ